MRRPVPGHPNRWVTEDGRVFNATREMKPQVAKGGYLFVWPYGAKRRRLWLHHAVLLAFVGPQPLGQECRHLNRIRTDNRPDNLAWGTRRENLADMDVHGTRPVGEAKPDSKLTEDQVREIRASTDLQRVTAAKYGISAVTVSQIKRRKKWAYLA